MALKDGESSIGNAKKGLQRMTAFALFSSRPSAWPFCGARKVRACSVFSFLSSTLIDHLPTPALPGVSHLISRHQICWWLNLDGSNPRIPKWTYHFPPQTWPFSALWARTQRHFTGLSLSKGSPAEFQRGKKSKPANTVSRGRCQIREEAYRQWCQHTFTSIFLIPK